MQITMNLHRGKGLQLAGNPPMPSTNADAVAKLLSQCPAHKTTPLSNHPDLAKAAGVAQVMVKDERTRMGLGSFKALGAAYVIATEAAAIGGDLSKALAGRTYVSASAGNHGMSVAAGARVFGAKAVIYLAETVPAVFADRLRALGATVVVTGHDYTASMVAAMADGAANGWTLLSDTSWDAYLETPHRLMEGYLQLVAEAIEQADAVPTHIFVQAGVGGLACAVSALVRARWGDAPHIIVVEPDRAPALQASIAAGKLVNTTGADSNMGRLDCKEASLIALAGLSRDADSFALITDEQADDAMPALTAAGLETSQSGGAGLVALLNANGAFGLTSQSRVLCFLSEGPA